MKKAVWGSASFMALVLVSVGAVMAITKDQATVMPVLKTLKLELQKSNVIGGDQKYKVTKATLDLLKKAMDNGDVITLKGDGTIVIGKDKGDVGDKGEDK